MLVALVLYMEMVLTFDAKRGDKGLGISGFNVHEQPFQQYPYVNSLSFADHAGIQKSGVFFSLWGGGEGGLLHCST